MEYLMRNPNMLDPSVHWSKIGAPGNLQGEIVSEKSDYTVIYYLNRPSGHRQYIYWDWREESTARAFLGSVCVSPTT